MKKLVFLLMCLFCCVNSPLKANEDLLNLFHLAVENGDVKLVTEVIDALLKDKNNNKHLLDALARYSEKGKIDFALHKAIKDKNLLASVILVQYTKDLNARQENEVMWQTSGMGFAGYSRLARTPIELALGCDMVEIIPYLLMKKADPYLIRPVSFFLPEEENLDYMLDLGYKIEKKTCVKSKQEYLAVAAPGGFSRTLIGEIIAKNRIDIIEMLQKMFLVDWNKKCCKAIGVEFTPLQFALTIKRYEIAQFLLDHGARIE